MACLMKFGALPDADDPFKTQAEFEALKAALGPAPGHLPHRLR
jgi:hypothetical protein